MTNLSDFSDDELAQILDAPGAVLKGATLADGQPGAIQFFKEMASGAKVFREAQEHENDFVRAVAVAMRARLGEQDATDRAATEGARPDPEGETARAVELTGASVTVLRERADAADVEAYADWILRIAEEVAEAAGTKEGGFFSKRVLVSAGERDFIDRLTAAVGR